MKKVTKLLGSAVLGTALVLSSGVIAPMNVMAEEVATAREPEFLGEQVGEGWSERWYNTGPVKEYDMQLIREYLPDIANNPTIELFSIKTIANDGVEQDWFVGYIQNGNLYAVSSLMLKASPDFWLVEGIQIGSPVVATPAQSTPVVTTPAPVSTTATPAGQRTPLAQLRSENFPVGSTQVVDYATALNVRRGIGTNHAAFTHLNRGDSITVLEFRSGWVRIDTTRGQGWIYAGYLRR